MQLSLVLGGSKSVTLTDVIFTNYSGSAGVGVIRACFFGKECREILLVSQLKSNHNICGIRPDCGSEIFQEYGLKYDIAFKGRNLLEIDVI